MSGAMTAVNVPVCIATRECMARLWNWGLGMDALLCVMASPGMLVKPCSCEFERSDVSAHDVLRCSWGE